jgi:predicted transcriptional regulator of viral defense system
MKLINIYHKLNQLEQPVLRTNDVAAYLDITTTNASKILARLSEAKHIVHLARGLWAFPMYLDILALPQYLTAPFPSYISLQTALYYHGMVSQLPEVLYAISLARSKRFITPLGVISIHHVQPDFFFGYEEKSRNVKMATPEKALVDIFYLTPAKSRLFTSLPELELPKDFSIQKTKNIINKIKSTSRKELVKKRFEIILHK